jgi:outer membrane protein OmpA-like peptidoglycan-associated protein
MRRKDFDLNYWPSVADFMLALFILAIATGALTMVMQRLETLTPLGGTLLRISKDRKADLEAAEAERNQLRNQLLMHPDAPPNIVLGEADGYKFASGSAEIEQRFRDKLREKYFPELVETIREDRRVDTIEVVGHTDSSPVIGISNLDTELGKSALAQLKPGSNADLGLLRALAVRAEWIGWLERTRTKLPRNIEVRCYSAANTIPFNPTDLGRGRDDSSRRIEIRCTQLKPHSADH